MTAPEPQPRGVGAEAMLARVRPHLAAFGITRVGVLTGLDVLGIPVAAAYRPNSRSIAVHQGKGTTLAGARISAVMEAVECWHAEHADLPLRLATAQEIGRHGDAVDIAALPHTGDPAGARLLWTSGRDMACGRPVWVPFELVSADFTAPAPAGFGLFRQTTNGLASGGTPAEAMLQGLCETVERHALARWHAGSATDQAACAVEATSVTGAANRWLLDRFAQAGVAARLWDITGPVGVPVFVAVAAEADGVAGVEAELGAGCHPSAEVAVARALLEAAQARLTRISGARDDFPPETYHPAARAARHDAAHRLLAMPARQTFHPCAASGDVAADTDATLARLARAGFASAVCVDLSRPEFGIAVARVIVPGLDVPA